MTLLTSKPLDRVRVAALLHADSIAYDLWYVDAVASTNTHAFTLPGARHGTVVVAEFQREGRGRRGRTWKAPAHSSILMSIMLATPESATPFDLVSACALAASDAIFHVTGLSTTLKWPNDIVVDDRKLAGILAEKGRTDGLTIIGIGINGNFEPSCIKDGLLVNATTLLHETGKPVEREALLAAFLSHLDIWYRDLTQTPGSVFTAWMHRLSTLGRRIQVIESTGAWEGLALSVTDDGALEVRNTEGDIHVLYAADISIRPT
jgi:BirA family transcriptional regulator, biotin operon repressor / biotin---[acetyl-CoA-carboxylase] ligase